VTQRGDTFPEIELYATLIFWVGRSAAEEVRALVITAKLKTPMIATVNRPRTNFNLIGIQFLLSN
jgi:hypothetical protein